MHRMRTVQALKRAFFTVICFVVGLAALGSPKASDSPKVAETFAFFGCNRIDPGDYERTRKENPSSANIPQLRRNLEDISRLSPDFVFFGGDLVMGYAADNGEALRSQMTAWMELVKGLPRSPKTKYVVITGNHELNKKVGDLKLPNPAMEGVWSATVLPSGLIPAHIQYPTPQNSPEDNLIADQRALSFSFDRGSVHFVVLNTDTRVSTKDPRTGDTKTGMVPTHWLENDLNAAEKNRGIRCVVVMGHKNVANPESVKGDDPINPECAGRMMEILKAHPKARAYVCAHVHAFDITNIGDSGLKQVIFGNGGSTLEKGWRPARGRTFGFGYFKVYTDGSLGVVPYLRPEPKNYMAEETQPATPEAELIIPAR